MKKIIFLILTPIYLLATAFILIFKIKIYVIDSTRIGHLSLSIELFLRKNKKKNIKGFFVFIKPISNKYLFNQYLDLIKKKGLKRFFLNHDFLNKANYLSKKIFKTNLLNAIKYKSHPDIEYIMKTKPVLNIKKDKAINKIYNLPSNAKWVCIHNRDSKYLNEHLEGDYSYHDYRNFSVKDMISASEFLTKKGFYVIRVGSKTKEKLNSKNKKIIDYSNHPKRNEKNDIYFLANCNFYLGSTSGIGNIPLIFGVPRYCINVTPISSYYICKRREPVILKKLYSTKLNKILSLKEIFKYNFDKFDKSQQYKKNQIRLISNSRKEILDLTKEALQKNKKKKNKNGKKEKELFKVLNYNKLKNKNILFNPIGKNFLKKLKLVND